MKAPPGGPDRSAFTKDDLMAEFFLKPSSSIIRPGDDRHPAPLEPRRLRGRVCAVIGKKARNLARTRRSTASSATPSAGTSASATWGRNRQNTRNIRKGFDTFSALARGSSTKDELPEPQDTRILVELNGKHVMTAHTKDMICGVRDHIRSLVRY